MIVSCGAVLSTPLYELEFATELTSEMDGLLAVKRNPLLARLAGVDEVGPVRPVPPPSVTVWVMVCGNPLKVSR
jgi:hypothetical protein